MENKEIIKKETNINIKLDPKKFEDKNVKKVKVTIEYLLK